MIENLSELTNVELYDELVPIIKQLCENFFYKDINNYLLKIEDTDLFFKLYDIALDYEYSKTPNLYKSIDDEGEIFFTGRGFQDVRAKKGSDMYKQIKWGEVYNNAKDVLDSKHLNELMQRYVEAPCHAMPYFLNNEIYYDWIKDKNDSDDEVDYKLMLYNDPFVIDEINKYPELHVYLGLKFGNINENFEWLESLFKYQVEDFAYVMLKMYNNYLNGLNGFSKSEEIAKHILEELFKREWMTEGRQSSRPYALFGRAYYELGKCYQNGILFEQDYAKARYCYMKAGQGVGKKVIPALGDMYYYGLGVDINYDIAFACYNDNNSYNEYAQDEAFAKLTEDEYLNRLSKFNPEEQDRLKNIELEYDFDFDGVKPEIAVYDNPRDYEVLSDLEAELSEYDDLEDDDDDDGIYDDEEELVNEEDDTIEYESKFDNDNDGKYEDIEKETLKKLTN